MTSRGITPETAPYHVSTPWLLEVVVEVVDVEAAGVPGLSWLQSTPEVVCKVHFSMTYYLAEYYLILVHRIHLFLGSFA